jgi:hypothetical protein
VLKRLENFESFKNCILNCFSFHIYYWLFFSFLFRKKFSVPLITELTYTTYVLGLCKLPVGQVGQNIGWLVCVWRKESRDSVRSMTKRGKLSTGKGWTSTEWHGNVLGRGDAARWEGIQGFTRHQSVTSDRGGSEDRRRRLGSGASRLARDDEFDILRRLNDLNSLQHFKRKNVFFYIS